jgi:PKD repeat protein
MLNFIFSGSNYTCTFKNSSDLEFKKYLEFSSYKVNWGDSPIDETLTTTSRSHTYLTPGEYEVVLTGINPWGTNRITKKVFVPFTGATTLNARGNATFTPAGGSWATTSFSYDYIFSGDANCNSTTDDIRLFNTGNTIPFLITGYTQSSLRDLRQYGSTPYKPLISVTANTGAIGMYSGVSQDGLYTAYTINDIDYYDYQDGTTLFVTYSSGLTRDMVVCQPIVKNELLLGIIDEAEVQSNIFIERGKNSALERIQRFGEVDNIGDLEKYGYKFFNIITT